jgi:hypothetical protein
MSYLNFFLTFPDRLGWVLIQAPSLDDARVFAVRNYLGDWELSWEEDFEPWLFPAGEVNAFAVEPAGGGYVRTDTQP